MAFPRMCRVTQELEGPVLRDVAAGVRTQIESLNLASQVKPGQTIAVTAGSRGVANIAAITHAVVDAMKALGLRPFIVPTMGSHGEAKAEGQPKMIEHYGSPKRAWAAP